MAHTIRITDNGGGGILDKNEVIDLIEILFRWEDSKFHIIFDSSHKRYRGVHIFHDMTREHEITLFKKNIKNSFESGSPIGGSQKAQSLKCAMAQTLAHELQHANQARLHRKGSSFYEGHRYWNLASEREARNFVDERLNEICAYFNLPPVMRRAHASDSVSDSSEVEEVIGLLAECDSVSPDDVNDELRASGILSPANVMKVRKALTECGVEIKKKEKVYFRI